MNYIYDILINLQRRAYDFFEWNDSDEIIHVRKIPFFKISTNDLYQLKRNNVILNEEFLKKINNRCEVFVNKSIKTLNYVCIFSDDRDVLVLELGDKGEKKRSSRLLIDEELDVIEVGENIELTNLDYNIIEEKNPITFKTRKELKMYDYILRQLIDDNYRKLKYLYFECFDREEDDFSKIVMDITNELNNNWNNIYEKIYNFFRLSSQRK